jgi:N-acetyl-gamma-glutamyl-phosphate reductase
MNKIKVGIVGATGLTGEKLIKLLLNHKFVELEILVSESNTGNSVEDAHKNLKGLTNKKFDDLKLDKIVEKCDCVFLCKGHGEFIDRTSELVKLSEKKNKNLKIIDLSADFRLKNISDYSKWYKFSHTASDLLQKSVYGLTELHHENIKKSNLVANPGCYPTAIILGVAPLFKNKLVNENKLFVNALSGVSGAGTKPNDRNIAIQVLENIMPYKVCNHQHTPEIVQELNKLTGNNKNEKVSVTFIPNIAPFKDGILATSFVSLKPVTVNITPKTILEYIYNLYKEFYKDSKFVRICKLGEYPEIKNVVHTNFCDIGLAIDETHSTLVVISAIDNLIKGASGQAIQNMNIMFGFDETECLI